MVEKNELIAWLTAHLPAGWQEQLASLQETVLAPQSPLRLVVLGSFSVGKSSLLNMLLQQQLLYTAAEEATAVPTFIDYGAEAQLALVGPDASVLPMEPEAFSRASANPPPGVACATVALPQPWLRGVTVVDLPGLGSISAERMEYTAAQVQDADAVLYLIEPRGPSQLDMAALSTVRQYGKRVLVAVARWDVVEAAAQQGEKAPDLKRWAQQIEAQAGLRVDLLRVSRDGLGRDEVLGYIAQARAELVQIRLRRFQAELAPLLQNALGSNAQAQLACTEQSESEMRTLHAAVLERKQQLLQTKEALYQRQQEDRSALADAAESRVRSERERLAAALRSLEEAGVAESDWSRVSAEGAAKLREALAVVAAALSELSGNYGELRLPPVQVDALNLRLPAPAPVETSTFLESGKLAQLEQALLARQADAEGAQRKLDALPQADLQAHEDQLSDLLAQRQRLLNEPLARIIQRTEGNGASQIGRFVGEVADIAMMFVNPTAVGAKVASLVGKGAKVAKVVVNVEKIATVTTQALKVGQALKGSDVHGPIVPPPLVDKLKMLEMLSLGYWGERIGNMMGGAATKQTVVDPEAQAQQQRALAELDAGLQQTRLQLERHEQLASQRQLTGWALEQSRQEAERIRAQIGDLKQQLEQREEAARQQAQELHQRALALAVQRACGEWLRSFDQQAAGMAELLLAQARQYWEERVDSTLAVSLQEMQEQMDALQAAPQVRQERLAQLQQEAQGLAAALGELQ